MYLLGTGGAEDAAVYCIKLWKHIVTVDSFSSQRDTDYGEEGEQKFDPKMGNGNPWHPNGCNPLPTYKAEQGLATSLTRRMKIARMSWRFSLTLL